MTLELKEKGQELSMVWKIYSWFLAACLAFAYYDIFTGIVTVPDLIDMPISIVALIGLFGYAYKKRIYKKQYWQVWLVLLIMWDILYNFFLVSCRDVQPVLVALGLLMFLPEYIALYKYSFGQQLQWE